MYPLLERIDDPADLRRARPRASCRELARELRAFLLASVAQTGGHLSSNLGTVELTIALHYVFDTPHDRIVWDVGHQTYAHKILTGRRAGDGEAAAWRAARRASRGARRANTTRSAPRIRRRRSPRRSAWRSRRSAQGRDAPRRRGDRRRRDERGHGVRGAQQRRHQRRRPARDPERQRHVDLASRSARSTSYLARLLSSRLYNTVRRGGKEVLSKLPAGARSSRKRCGRAREGHGAARHAVRGVRLQLHRPDRRPRPRRAGAARSPTSAS